LPRPIAVLTRAATLGRLNLSRPRPTQRSALLRLFIHRIRINGMNGTTYQSGATAISATGIITGGTPVLRFSITMPSEAQELTRGLRRRDPDLLDRLIEQYHYRLFRYLFSLTGNREAAEDLFQETWIRVLERGHQYNAKWKFGTWLFTIARNLFVDSLRRKNPAASNILDEQDEPLGFADTTPSDTPSPFDLQARREESDRVARALEGLTASYREVLVLRFQEDLDLNEIAAVTAAPLSTVKARLYRGMDALREVLERGQA
jgi:RNA polymerase sigma-70 factor (ECF subfamily)